MSMETNPYQSPQFPPAPQGFGAPPAQQFGKSGLWRKGNILVMDKRAELPKRCVKSNQPAETFLKRTMSWHHPMIAISILVSPIIYIILAAVLSKRATIHIGLTNEWRSRRRTRILIAWVLVLASIIMFVTSFFLLDGPNPVGPWLMFGALFVFLGGLIYGMIATRLVQPTKITDDHVFLKGVHPEFLAGLPDWPYAV